MSWSVIRPQIKTLLQTISTIHEVSSHPKLKFDGYPAAYVIPSDQSGDFETTEENKRTYAFHVNILYETKSTGIESALGYLESVVDSVIDVFDQEGKKLTGQTIGVGLPANYMLMGILATPGRFAEIPEESLLLAEVIVRIVISVDVS